MKAKQFQYETQSYQEDCIQNIVQIFESLPTQKPFDNLQEQEQKKKFFQKTLTEHKTKNQYPFPVQDAKNIDIMMETGTGKTFTFIKTIFELNRNFGYQKFIILIPTVPIREGTKTNLEDTKDYFKSLYANEKEKEIEVFTYEGGNTSAVEQYIRSQHLSVLVMTPSSFSSKDNILNRPLEKEIQLDLFTYQNPIQTPKTYLECLKQLNPIVIMDEPHRFDGDAFKKYFEGFNNYYLRFGATFPRKKDSVQLSNVAYVLDSISSFRQNLVKKIVVYTQDIVESIDTLVGIERRGSKNIALIDTLSNGTIVRREVSVGGKFNGTSVRRINKDNIVLENDTIEKVDYSLSDESLRAMITQTISIHFQKEQMLFEQGIKALSLFFIESDTSLFRGENPKIKTLFEEEFKKKYDEVIATLDENSAYYQYLKNSFDADGNLQVHKGYFSGDKGNKDEKIKAGVDEILKDKKKLLSFESPTRFIFSIWALQEGWDNPNVFTICKLSNQGSEISKLQQIGRGLRICVNQNLQRQTFKNLGNNQEEFWKINNLDVVVSSKEQGFVESIQNEILNNSFLVSKSFTEKEIKNILQEKTNLDVNTIRQLFRKLENAEMIVFKDMIDGEEIFEKADNFATLLKEQNLPAEQEKALLDVFVSPSEINTFIKNGNKKSGDKKKIFIKQSHLQEFKDLWNTINQNAFYVLDTLGEENQQQLIENIKIDIENLQIDEILLQTKREILNVNKIDRQDAITSEVVSTQHRKQEVNLLEMVQWIASKTKTPLAFVVQIFNALNKEFKAENLANNPAQAQKEIVKIINKNLINTLKAHIRYDGISGKVLANVFQTENDKTYLKEGSVGKFQKDIDTDFALKEKWIFEEVIEYDSDFELQIIEKDPDISEIAIFGKLPQLKIKTPMGEYNPDFCYAIKGEQGNKVFLVVEAKGYDNSADIPESEKAKIDFAKRYFEALNEHYKDQNIKISFKERINRTQLSALVKG